MRKLSFLAFTDAGEALAARLSRALGGTVSRAGEGGNTTLADWTAARFSEQGGALVYIGAAGIAVRAIAPHLKNKASDPAVVALDEQGRFVIPLLSGHLGGANELARAIARETRGSAVITTATDVRGVFAVDEWARKQNCAIRPCGGIKAVSKKLLRGETITLGSAFPIAGELPDNIMLTQEATADVTVSMYEGPGLRVIPRCLTLGAGCRRGISCAQLEECYVNFCRESGLAPEAFKSVSSIDLKAEEPGLLEFCEKHALPLVTFSAEALRAVPGSFSFSRFVLETTGVDNVCERAAVLASGGRLLIRKSRFEGVTFAAAIAEPRLSWRWRDV